MTLSTREVLGLLDGKQMTLGRASNILRRDQHRPSLPRNQRAFVRAVSESLRERPAPLPQHPEDAASRHRTRRNHKGDLTAVELAWLDRLPRDPAQIRYEDAVELAALASSISAMEAPQSVRLVDAVWRPVKAIHDRRVAEARLARAGQPLPKLPEGILDALTEAVASQNPDWPEHAHRNEAFELLRSFEANRADARAEGLRKAEDQLNAIKSEAQTYADRTGEVAARAYAGREERVGD